MQIIDFPVQQKAPRQAEATSLLEDELTRLRPGGWRSNFARKD